MSDKLILELPHKILSTAATTLLMTPRHMTDIACLRATEGDTRRPEDLGRASVASFLSISWSVIMWCSCSPAARRFLIEVSFRSVVCRRITFLYVLMARIRRQYFSCGVH